MVHRIKKPTPMIAAWLLLIAMVHVSPGQTQPTITRAPSFQDSVELHAMLDELVLEAVRQYVAPAPETSLAIGVHYQGQEAFFGFGTTRPGKQSPPNHSTVYEIGSISKTFLGVLTAQAVAENKLRIDDDIRQYLDRPFPKLEFQGEPIRVRHLINMTSNLPDNIPDLREFVRDSPRSTVPFAIKERLLKSTRKEFLDELKEVELKEKPGISPSHSNAAAELLAMILEKVFNQPIDELIAHRIEQPLYMSSGFQPDEQFVITGLNQDNEPMPSTAIPVAMASGGLRYSVSDMLKYVRFQLDESQRPVAISHDPTWFTLDGEQFIGMFWMARKNDSGNRFRYSGGTFGFASYCTFIPKQKLGLILMANQSTPNTQQQLKAIADGIAVRSKE